MKAKQVKEPTQLAEKQLILIESSFPGSSLSATSFACCLRQFQHGGCRLGNPKRVYPIVIDDQSLGQSDYFRMIDYELITDS